MFILTITNRLEGHESTYRFPTFEAAIAGIATYYNAIGVPKLGNFQFTLEYKEMQT